MRPKPKPKPRPVAETFFPLTPARLDQAKRLKAQGRSLSDCARAVGVSTTALDVALWNNLGRPK